MNKLFAFAVVLLIIIGGFYILNSYIYDEKQGDDTQNLTEDTTEYDTFTNTTAGIMFEYKTAPGGYVVDDLSEFIRNEVSGVTVVKVFRVMNAREKIELETSEGGREGPPTINILVFENTNKQSASMWVDAVPQYSNIDFVIGEINRDAVVGGANAVRYRTDGLYVSENVVVAHGAYMYHFTGAYLEEDSQIYRDFSELIDSLTFIPTDTMPASGPSAKIDPQVACESALTYMTFPSSAEADAFVAACVNGEHPEVIERYISDMGLDGATI